MKELTDLEICKRIADIKGLLPKVAGGVLVTTRGALDFFDLSRSNTANKTARYLYELMFEFEVCVNHESGDVFICGGDDIDGVLFAKSFCSGCESSFRRAALLCIIGATHA